MWLIKILLMALFLVFLVQNNNDLVSVWPIPESSLMVGVSVVYLLLFCLGYLCGRLSAWAAYAPLRATLRKQKKENKYLICKLLLYRKRLRKMRKQTGFL